jgi:hypothetical protein
MQDHKLADHKFTGISPELRANLLDYYKDRKPPISPPTKKASVEWAELREQVVQHSRRAEYRSRRFLLTVATTFRLRGLSCVAHADQNPK